MTDEQFFATYPDRQARIRTPKPVLTMLNNHSVMYLPECEQEFLSLGYHQKKRRRILLYRIPPDNPHFDPMRPQLIKIPFLAFSDEIIEDNDAVLLPLVHRIMTEARAAQ